MARGPRGSEWLVFQRCLAILRRLQQGPAGPDELIDAVKAALGAEAYPAQETALKSAFKHDRDRLRNVFEVRWRFDQVENNYQLLDPGPLGYLDLPDEHLQSLKLLAETFAGEVGELAAVQGLLDELFARLPPEAQHSLEGPLPPVELDLDQGVDSQRVAPRVLEKVRRAVQSRRKLVFHYLSPLNPDELPRVHEVASDRIRFRRGHWYLHAYNLRRWAPDGREEPELGHVRYRLSRILDDDRLAVLPEVLPAALRRPPRYRVHYRLLGPLARGPASRHFDEMEIKPTPDGVEVQGFTDDAWEAGRILLGYGENCMVLGGPEVLDRVERAVMGMARNYGLVD